MIDIKLSNNSPTSTTYIDFTFKDGDIDTIDSFESSLIIALYAERERDVILDKDGGSYLHELDQSKLTTANLNLYRFHANEALVYLHDEGLITSKNVKIKQINNSDIALGVVLVSDNKEKVYQHEYRL